MNNEKTIFDAAIMGGGPAGMMAGIRAGEAGKRVVLIEKNRSLGRKLLLTGKGRCNLTHAEFNVREFTKEYGREGDFLLYPLSVFGAKEVIEFFEKRGLETKVERGKRVFPKSDKASDILGILSDSLKKNKVEIMTGCQVKRIVQEGKRIKKIVLARGKEIYAKNYIMATGGKAYPATGSTGEGYRFSESLGHSIIKPRPCLVPLIIKEDLPKRAQGLNLKNVKISVFQNGKEKDSRFGEALFTHFGLSGPIVLDLSNKVGELLEKGEVKLFLDLKPALSFEILDKRVQGDFAKYQKKAFKNSLSDLLPKKLISIIIGLSDIDPGKKVNEITKEERHGLVNLLKKVEMTVSGLLGFEEAIVTAGGVSLKEIDSKTMKSKLVDNLFFAGEIINLHGPSGGYNLQLCWSTGYLAGQNA